MYAFPRRSVGTRGPCTLWPPSSMAPDNPATSIPKTPATSITLSLALLIPPLALLRADALVAPSPLLRGEKFTSPCSHAPAWEQKTSSVMYAFPRRSVGTRGPCTLWPPPSMAPDNPATSIPKTPATSITLSLALLIPPLALLRADALAAPSPPQRGEIYFSLFPCSRVGTKNE